jgi:DnaJ-class molecular chaperone
MKMCDTCKGLGSVADAKLAGNTFRCKACGGTGLAIEATRERAAETKNKTTDKE